MTAPIWIAFPPEVHSATLSSGPGPGPLLASAGAWTALSTEYTEVAEELGALVTGVQAGAWEGPSAESYVAANAPYVAWLLQVAANSTEMAAQEQIAATAYTAALAAMPTLAELAANHVIHGVLMATNFFGINTIPIALNEADYVRMWIQAATTMSTYQAVSTAAVTAAPQTAPAPQIVKADATADPAASNPYDPTKPFNEFITQLVQKLGYTPPAHLPTGTIDTGQYPVFTGNILQYLMQQNQITLGELTIHPGETFGQELGQQIFFFNYATQEFGIPELQAISHGSFSQIFSLNTVIELYGYVIMRVFNVLGVINYLALNPAYLTPFLPLAAAPVGGLGGFAGLAGLAQQAAAVPMLDVPVPVAPLPVAAIPPAAGPAAVPAPVPAPVLAPTPVAAFVAPVPPAPGAPPTPPAGPNGFPYLVGGMNLGAQTSARAKTDEPLYRSGSKAPALAAGAATRQSGPVRRRRRTKTTMLGRGYEYMDLEPESGPVPNAHEPAVAAMASDRGTGPLGFAGTASKDTGRQAGGLATLAGDSFGGEPRMPMVPRSWEPEVPEGPLVEGDDS